MLSRFVNRLTILPRWIIIVIDLLLISCSTFLGYVLRFNFDWDEIHAFHPVAGIILSACAGLIATMITKSYAGIVRYTGIEDGVRIAKTTFFSLIIVSFINLINYYNVTRNLIPYSILLIAFPVSFFLLFFYRLLVKALFSYYKSPGIDKINVVIFGAGQLGINVKQMVDSNNSSQMKVAAFLEDDLNKVGKEIQGTRIYSTEDLTDVIRDNKARELIIAVNNLSLDRKNQLVDKCLGLHIKIRSVPPVERWVRGELSLRQIKEVNIEDLLGREVIVLNNLDLRNEIAGKVICITGAAGSIGSEIARQVLMLSPSKLVLIDQAETHLFEIGYELYNRNSQTDIQYHVADVTNEDRISKIFSDNKPEVIFHAAAYKHVPMMERNPIEAVICNIFGTRILADLAIKMKVKKFVMISTDKAVNPTSIMGCSKRIAEIYVQALNNHLERQGLEHTAFVTTRFGNVLGSNGSVIPLFKKQIERGGPVTVTHPEITRYFMTIPEACSLVLEAGVMGNGGEIFIFDMGKAVRIYDLAKKMIMLSGLELNKEIEITFTGLREGEKLYEELLNSSENTIPTHHAKILKAKVAEHAFAEISSFIDLLQDLVNDKNELKMVALMKEIVPEFKSNYSRFEVLDTE